MLCYQYFPQGPGLHHASQLAHQPVHNRLLPGVRPVHRRQDDQLAGARGQGQPAAGAAQVHEAAAQAGETGLRRQQYLRMGRFSLE